MAEHNKIGALGETLAQGFLIKQGFTFIEQNYRTKYGEIDLIMKKDSCLRFVEVKSIKVTDLSFERVEKIQPEDNLTFSKWSKLVVAIETYLKHRNVPHETKYQVDLACVYIDTERRQGKVKLLENINKE
jgi:putative endonuclease